MKQIFLVLCLMATSTSFASVIDVQCDVSDAVKNQRLTTARADSLDKLIYRIDLGRKTGKLLCSQDEDPRDLFCGSLRVDGELSRLVSTSQLDFCDDYDSKVRWAYNFVVHQEDEFYNYVTVYLWSTCDGSETFVSENRNKNTAAVVLVTSDSGSLPDGRFKTSAMECSVQIVR